MKYCDKCNGQIFPDRLDPSGRFKMCVQCGKRFYGRKIKSVVPLPKSGVPKLTKDQIAQVYALHSMGYSAKDIAPRFHVSEQTIGRAIKKGRAYSQERTDGTTQQVLDTQ